MNKRFFIDTLGWGILLWLVGYLAGMLLYFIVPAWAIGWVITPFATLLTLWVAFRKIKGTSFAHYVGVGLAWLGIAVLGDYFGIVKALNPADGYYKLDVYLYYALTFIIPLAAGIWARRKTA